MEDVDGNEMEQEYMHVTFRKVYYLFQRFQTGFRSHPAFYQACAIGSVHGEVKRPEHKIDHWGPGPFLKQLKNKNILPLLGMEAQFLGHQTSKISHYGIYLCRLRCYVKSEQLEIQRSIGNTDHPPPI
jgi:hypothetical protein